MRLRRFLDCSMQENANVDRMTEHGVRYGISEFKQGVAGGGGQDLVLDLEENAANAGNSKRRRDTQGSGSTVCVM